MSALNCIRQRNAVHLFGDAAAYDGDGIVQCFVPKQLALPHLSCIIGTRGSHRATYLLATVLGCLYSSFDEMLEGIEEAMPTIIEEMPPTPLCPRCDLTIAGWSADRGRGESYFMQTAENDWEPAADQELAGDLQKPEPFTLMALPEFSFAPVFPPDDLLAASRELGRSIKSPDDLDPAIDGLRVLEVQRQQCCARLPGGPERHWIGGFAVLGTVTADTVTQRIIGRWPDQVGEPITPAPVDWAQWNRQHPLPASPVQLSRLREEMLAKKARKAARR